MLHASRSHSYIKHFVLLTTTAGRSQSSTSTSTVIVVTATSQPPSPQHHSRRHRNITAVATTTRRHFRAISSGSNNLLGIASRDVLLSSDRRGPQPSLPSSSSSPLPPPIRPRHATRLLLPQSRVRLWSKSIGFSQRARRGCVSQFVL